MDTMTEQDWEDIDRSSRAIVSCLLENTLSATSIGEMHGNCCIDLSCIINDKRIAIEIKDRSFPHDRFGDILVEGIKQECTSRRIDNNQFDTALAVNVFNDKTLAIANMYDKAAKHFKRYAPATTLVKGADHSYVLKDFTSLPQKYLFKFHATSSGTIFKRIHKK